LLTDRVRAMVDALDESGRSTPRTAPPAAASRPASRPGCRRPSRTGWGITATATARAGSLLDAGLSLGLRPSPDSPTQRDPAMDERFARLIALSPFHRAGLSTTSPGCPTTAAAT
jgi:hypothetical protein